MRITQNMLTRNLTYAMTRNFEELNSLNKQLSTGMRVNTVSDDVVAAQSIMALTRENKEYDTYLRNLTTADAVLDVAANALATASEVIGSIKELAVQAASETYTPSDLEAMAVSMDGMLGTLVTVVSAKSEAGYVFSGESADREPYDVVYDDDGQIAEVNYAGEMISTTIRVGSNTTAEANLVGEHVINRNGDLFATIIDLRDAIADNDQDEIERLMGELDDRHTDVRTAIGQLGERMTQQDVLRRSTEAFQDFNQELISSRQDADMAEVTVEYNTQMVLLQMVMKVASQAIAPSLADFM